MVVRVIVERGVYVILFPVLYSIIVSSVAEFLSGFVGWRFALLFRLGVIGFIMLI
ncbi:hypothetical protein B9Z19DRAFT_1087447, partial [Tuber borchii]